MQALYQHGAVLLIGWASGINLYLAVALTGISGRMGWLDLPHGMEPLTNPLIIGIALILYGIEFCADKIPIVDSIWDSAHTLIRPAGATIMGFMAGTEYGPMAQAATGLFTGAVALDMHALKATSRAAINMSPEPVTNITASLVEDAAVIGAFWFFHKHPVVTCIIIVLILIGAIFVIMSLWKFVVSLFRRHKKGDDNPTRSAEMSTP